MTFPICPQYAARHEEDGTWSILDLETGKVAVVGDAVTLKRLDEATAMEIVDALRVDYCRKIEVKCGKYLSSRSDRVH